MHGDPEPTLFHILYLRRWRRLLCRLLIRTADGVPGSSEYKHTGRCQYLPSGVLLTAVKWYDLAQKDSRQPPDPTSHPLYRNHRFFDSKGPGGLSTPRPASSGELRAQGGQVLEIDKNDITQFAHFGYVYCMLLARGISRDDADSEVLISGGGDGTIKLWSLHKSAPRAMQEIYTLENGDNSVLAMTIDGTFLYSGRLEGDINVWDLDTRQLIRSVKAHSADVLTLAATNNLIISGGSNGYAQVWNHSS